MRWALSRWRNPRRTRFLIQGGRGKERILIVAIEPAIIVSSNSFVKTDVRYFGWELTTIGSPPIASPRLRLTWEQSAASSYFFLPAKAPLIFVTSDATPSPPFPSTTPSPLLHPLLAPGRGPRATKRRVVSDIQARIVRQTLWDEKTRTIGNDPSQSELRCLYCRARGRHLYS